MNSFKLKNYAVTGALISALVMSTVAPAATANFVDMFILGHKLNIQNIGFANTSNLRQTYVAPTVPVGGKGNLHNVTQAVTKGVKIVQNGNGFIGIKSGTITAKLSPTTGLATYKDNVAFNLASTPKWTQTEACNLKNGTSKAGTNKLMRNGKTFTYPKTTAALQNWASSGYIKSGIDTKNPGPYKSDSLPTWHLWTRQPTLNQIPKTPMHLEACW